MQLFLPLPNIKASVAVLDKRRCFKQVIEAKTIIDIIETKNINSRWYRHPATRMVFGHIDFVKLYYNIVLAETFSRGVKTKYEYLEINNIIAMPDWFGSEKFHFSHAANLSRKAIDDKNGISARGKPKKPSNELYNRLVKANLFVENYLDISYCWPVD